jgi:hypothetical protein
MIQSGRHDWIINAHPSGTSTVSHGHRVAENECADKKRGFYLAASHRQIKVQFSASLAALR